jgi:ABC-type cobalamin transport system ATPase subunit
MITSKVPSMGIEPKAGNFLLLVGPRSLNQSMLTAIARLAEGAPVRVLDGGNRFNAYSLARLARGRSEVLERITVSRAFTCYQVLALLESTPATPSPFIVLDLLNSFYDESVQAGERKRLLRLCLAALHRLERAAGGAVSVHPPAVPSQTALELLGMLQSATPEVYFVQPVPQPAEPLRLF